MFRPVRKVAAPGTKSAIPDCILFWKFVNRIGDSVALLSEEDQAWLTGKVYR